MFVIKVTLYAHPVHRPQFGLFCNEHFVDPQEGNRIPPRHQQGTDADAAIPSISLISLPNTAVLSHKKPASVVTSRGNGDAQESDKTNAL